MFTTMTKTIRICAALASFALATAAPPELKRPDDKPADQTKKVKVFILMGQSNMVGMGDINPAEKPGTLTTLTKTEKKYPYLVDDTGQWTVRKDVYYYDARVKKGSPLSATSNNGNSIGPELGFGFVMEQLLDEPVLVLKSCIGNRSLGWDLLPPGSERYTSEVTERNGQKVTKTFAGYKGQGYEIAGFVWWLGNKDQNDVHASRYEQNLARLIPSLRKDYNAPNAKLVLATGCGFTGREGFGLQIAEAQLAVGDAKKHPEFIGNLKAVDSRDLWREADVSPKNQGYHYNRNAETYMEVGLRLGWAMAELLKGTK